MNRLYNDIKRLMQNPTSAYRRIKQFEDYYWALKIDFFGQEYYWLYQRIKPHTTVIDIGARIGDTAIYFAMHPNVEHVLAYEPVPALYREAVGNLRQSEIGKKKVEIFNSAISATHGVKYLDNRARAYSDFSFRNQRSKSGGTKVESFMLDEVLTGRQNVVIKSNCEGEEDTFFEDTDLTDVYAIQLEFKAGQELQIQHTLQRNGFKTKIKVLSEQEGHIMAWRS